MSRLTWDAKTQTCVVADPTELPADFQWVPPPDALQSLVEPSERVRLAILQVTHSIDGVNFQRLMRDDDYRARFAAGYREGVSEGRGQAIGKWVDDYLSVLVVLFNGLMGLADAVTTVSAEFFRAAIIAWFASPQGSPLPPVEDPRFAQLLASLRAPRQPNPSPAIRVTADDDEDDEDPNAAAAHMLEAAAYADGMARVARSGQAQTLLGALHLAYQDWVDELAADAAPLWQDAVALNCQPAVQGQLLGAWEGILLVNTFRAIVEAALRLVGNNPQLFLSGLPGANEAVPMVIDEVIGIVTMGGEDGDDD